MHKWSARAWPQHAYMNPRGNRAGGSSTICIVTGRGGSNKGRSHGLKPSELRWVDQANRLTWFAHAGRTHWTKTGSTQGSGWPSPSAGPKPSEVKQGQRIRTWCLFKPHHLDLSSATSSWLHVIYAASVLRHQNLKTPTTSSCHINRGPWSTMPLNQFNTCRSHQHFCKQCHDESLQCITCNVDLNNRRAWNTLTDQGMPCHRWSITQPRCDTVKSSLTVFLTRRITGWRRSFWGPAVWLNYPCSDDLLINNVLVEFKWNLNFSNYSKIQKRKSNESKDFWKKVSLIDLL